MMLSKRGSAAKPTTAGSPKWASRPSNNMGKAVASTASGMVTGMSSLYQGVDSAAFGRILKVTGPRGLYTGYLPTVIEDVPDMAFKFASYETLGSIYYRAVGKARAEANRIDDLIVGGAAGSIAAALTTPVDVIKTRMMCDAASRPTIFSAARAVAAEGRIGAWFAGVGPRSLSSGINSAVFFMFLESLRQWQARREAARIKA